ncbi:GNAT family N-acetyltransferase (plasmid) [Rhizobium johnstonii]|nr:GNAT family N-acetyltransferase [Rhizobium johnstonii]
MIEKDMRHSATAQSLTVEPASAADIPFIMSIERSPGYQALVGSYDATEHRRRMEAPTCTYLLCRNAGELVGFAVIRRDDDGMGTAQLHRIAVSPPGNGYGSAFLRKICRWVFSEHGLDRLWLDVLPSNVNAARLYEKLGFVREGVMRASLRVPGGREDLVLMSLLREDWEAH